MFIRIIKGNKPVGSSIINKKSTWVLCILIGIGISIPITIGVLRQCKIYTKGSLVKVLVVNVPDNSRGNSNGRMNFEFNGKPYDISVRGPVSKVYHVGDTILLRYLNEDEGLFMLPNKNPIIDGLLYFIAMSIAIAGCVYYLINTPVVK